MSYAITDDHGRQLDAQIDLDDGGLILHSRGGTKGSSTARNLDYGVALRLILDRLQRGKIEVEAAWVDSSRALSLTEQQRTIIVASELNAGTEVAFRLMSDRMARVGQKAGKKGGNPTKRVRFRFSHSYEHSAIEQHLRLVTKGASRSAERLLGADLKMVTATHLFNAINRSEMMPTVIPSDPRQTSTS